MVLRRIFGPKREKEEAGEYYNEELHNLYTLSNIGRVIKSSRMSWAGHIAYVLVSKPGGKRQI